MDENFNISDLAPITVANPKKATVFKDPYKIERVVKEGKAEHFRFSPQFFEELNLASRSCGHFKGKEGTPQEGKVILAVLPENQGTWAKASTRGNKRRIFKVSSLAGLLDKTELANVKHLDLEKKAEIDGVDYYEIIANADENYAGKTINIPATEERAPIAAPAGSEAVADTETVGTEEDGF